ncbi:tripartite tricarboxylate transporter TctB family protein [Bacillus sp. Marseille-P3661]|uniref:tripartite tricarboxylate transporter TctB family protein n=1 Tax=Bacillus sp. Marseille-P3661 TaxID=1936234 RepID=UPI0015E1A708|nr:tripartite tricarboxylate transporter TctB family protein [Bacillus sp. Marseille-P3661]
MNYFRLLKRTILPLLLYVFIFKHYLEVKAAPNPYDILLIKVMLIIASVSFVFILIEEYKLQRVKKDDSHNDKIIFSRSQLVLFTYIVLYVGALYVFGFVLSTVLFLVFSFLHLKYSNWKICILTPICFALFLHLIFVELLSLKLPSGILWAL